MKLNPENDGVDHINIYSKGKTKLGRGLTNFAHLPFKHPIYGKFESLEGYWYWISTGKQHDHLRSLYGFNAKKKGKELDKVDNPDFEKDLRQGVKCKLYQRPNLFRDLLNNTLPLKHYYCYGDKVIVPDGPNWDKIFNDIKNDFLEVKQ